MLYGIAAATAALLLAAVLTALIRAPALRAGIVDRRRHRQRPVPVLGGLAVVAVTCLVAWAGQWTRVAPLGGGIAKLLAAAAAVAVLGLVADVWRLRARVLVAATAVAAACVVPYDETGVLGGVLAVGWIVLSVLAFRGLDHADGLAGTVGVITAFGAGACAAVEVLDGLAVLLSVFAAALTGFLMHNWHPARIGLGACGSLFTGFLLSSSVVLTRAGYGIGSSVAVVFCLGAVAFADAVLVVLVRLLGRRPLLRRGPDHLTHRLRRLGLTPQGSVVLLGAGSFSSVLVGVLVHTGWMGEWAVLWVAGGVVAAVLVLLRVPVPRSARVASTQVRGALRVRNG
ncbi:undecaprenyl/decaprenyl-phosphate alpha-N-acetylglucosaminyl 1-phosphate transferase [Streptomyces pluripotens]|uniref:Undecaprenyl/decaprenyl-phosphate alpha-N-acetylglucosaminyl 1-phosphate transferase n=1 Tax=Streptomyces pluripotens TaxID=1355015 RepID=A0A221NZ47_9ACTN|nr:MULTISPECIES: MraY family glycosyltransferase [Streptomyces]ARP71005.1 undecaprenyl-phosphate alpha-N-acetylglucosaminyl 1-phosphate transferase [Streptomyces pluripotens]ASN25257.1 undecaprenyl/decaprenyl-phosphate alpha-N-acetylglucosaminyl 1-phosphate transferase [Streptomyces pluripotens]KIE27700.1 glycosyl transferase [Streptomyces sp. MUSC 125]MCH0559794.1 undecaprenyl/decaprenyl-phosphate alpha-N-acetylglucosaminyl 1-phosphate transferase [Streptomyces sp. MUM 16J]